MHAADPVVVVQTQYVTLDGALVAPVESAWGFDRVWTNGDMYDALAHDSRWLETCRAQLDGIRKVYDQWSSAHAPAAVSRDSRAVTPVPGG